MMTNFYLNRKGQMVKLGYKTEKGLLSMIKKINQSCIKLGYETEISIRLPIKRSHNHKAVNRPIEISAAYETGSIDLNLK